jgi:protein-S-isoprenylcysteine O-methyltransferase Ste14
MREGGYGLWFLVVVNSALVILFAGSCFHPRTTRDWKAMGAFSAFVVALFTEMYGFPLTLYLLSGWLVNRFPALRITHNGGHLWTDLIGWRGDPHLSPFHLASFALIGAGLWLIASGWKLLWAAQRSGSLATTGPYARVRHPQYAGFLLIMVGFLVQWPTFATLLMFPVLILVYRRLAIAEEQVMHQEFGLRWDRYARSVPRFFPRLRTTPESTRATRVLTIKDPRVASAPQGPSLPGIRPDQRR